MYPFTGLNLNSADPFMGNSDNSENCSVSNKIHSSVFVNVDRYYSDNCELPDLFKKYGDLFSESETNDNLYFTDVVSSYCDEFESVLEELNSMLEKQKTVKLNTRNARESQRRTAVTSTVTSTSAILTTSSSNNLLSTPVEQNPMVPLADFKPPASFFDHKPMTPYIDYKPLTPLNDFKPPTPLVDHKPMTPHVDYKPPTPSYFLTPMPTPSPYSHMLSSPDCSKKKGGRPQKNLDKVQKAFEKKKKSMTKKQRKTESNNIASIKSRRKKKMQLKEWEAEELKQIVRMEKLQQRYTKYEAQIKKLMELLGMDREKLLLMLNEKCKSETNNE